jgi:hypothetical protein
VNDFISREILMSGDEIAAGEDMRKTCWDCGLYLPVSEFGRLRRSLDGHGDRCQDCRRESRRLSHLRRCGRLPRPAKVWPEPGMDNYERHLWNAYRLTPERFDAILADQGYRCAICGTDDPGWTGLAHRWHVDHDPACCPNAPTCGRCVRGILCANCNLGLGRFKDSPAVLARASRYVAAYVSTRSAA